SRMPTFARYSVHCRRVSTRRRAGSRRRAKPLGENSGCDICRRNWSSMTTLSNQSWSWIWPSVGATPIHQGLDSEMFDRTDYPYSETFVREAIQNSLDARLDPAKPVVVNFTFHSNGIGPRRQFLEQVMNHREKAGLEIPREWKDGNVRWLVVEDFNSKGLGGDLGSRVSDFWNYWLNFGLTNKDGSGRGG